MPKVAVTTIAIGTITDMINIITGTVGIIVPPVPSIIYGSPYRQRYYGSPYYEPPRYYPPPVVYGPGLNFNFKFADLSRPAAAATNTSASRPFRGFSQRFS